jgi:hypothetical protein
MKMNIFWILFVVGIALFAPPAWAAEEATPVNTIEIDELTCKQLMAGNDLERDVVIAYYHGIMDGKKQVGILDIPEASAISDEVRDYCLSNPTNTVMKAFEKFHK